MSSHAFPTEPIAVVEASDGAELAVWASGDTRSTSVVLLHGFSLDHGTWDPVANHLVASGHRVVAPDLRGHGRSGLGSASPTAEQLVADVAAVIEGKELGAVHLVGHSLGAVVALAARTSPVLDGQLLSVTSVAGTERSIQNPVMKLGARLFSSTLGIKMLRRERPGRSMISTWFGRKPEREQLDWIRLLSAACPTTTRRAISDATADVDLRPSFAVAGPPTLVIAGERDQATSAKVSGRIAASIGGAELEVVDDAGHMVIIERPDVVADRLDRWVRALR